MTLHFDRRRRAGLAASIFLLLNFLASSVLAAEFETTTTATLSLADAHQTLVIDERPLMTQPPTWDDSPGPHELRRRAEEHSTSTASTDSDDGDTKSESQDGDKRKDDESSSTAAEHASKTIASKDMTKVSSMPLSVRTSSSTTAAATTSALPTAFDGIGDSGFQSSGSDDACPTFMKNLLQSPDFNSCYPLSMMLQTSTSFFDAEKQVSSIVRVLDATCGAQSTQCASYLSKAAANLTAEANCKVEYDAKQANVVQAYSGLVAYKVLYDATCLQDPDQDMYCFAEAVTNSSTVSDNYLYFLPFGLALPGASTPSCNWCTKNTMAVFHAATADHQDPLYQVYAAAATQVNTICGVNWVNSTVAEEQVAAAVRGMPSYTVLGSVLAAAVLSMIV